MELPSSWAAGSKDVASVTHRSGWVGFCVTRSPVSDPTSSLLLHTIWVESSLGLLSVLSLGCLRLPQESHPASEYKFSSF